MPMTGTPPAAQQSGAPMPSGEFLIEIPALIPKRQKVKVADTVAWMRDKDEISLMQNARMVQAVVGLPLTELSQPGFLLRLTEAQAGQLVDAINIAIEIGFVQGHEPGLPAEVLDQIGDAGRMQLAYAWIDYFFGLSRIREIVQSEADEAEPESLEDELDRIVGSIGAAPSRDSGAGSGER